MKKKIIKSLAGIGVLRIASIPVSLLVTIILARVLGVENFGFYTFILALVPLISLPVSGGLLQLLTREFTCYLQDQDVGSFECLIKVSSRLIIINTSVLVGGYVFSNYIFNISLGEKWEFFPIAILMVPLIGFTSIRSAILRSLKMPVLAELEGQIVQPLVVLMLIGLLYIFIEVNVLFALWCKLLATLTGLLFVSYVVRRSLSRIYKKKARGPTKNLNIWGFYKSLMPFTLMVAIGTLNTNIGTLLLGVMGSDTDVSAMKVAERGSQFVLLSLLLVNAVIGPYIVESWKSQNIDELQKLAKYSARGAFLIAVPISLFLLFFGDLAIEVLFGYEYSEIAYIPLCVLVVGQLVNVFTGSVGLLLVMSGHEMDTVKGQLVSLLVAFLACVVLIPKYGALGATLGITLGLISWNIILAVVVKVRLNIRPSVL